MADVTFGQRIRALRKELGLSQRDLAQRVGIDFTYLSKIENSRGEPPSEAVIKRVATELRADAHELIVLAGKIPSDLARVLAEHPEELTHLRRLMSGDKRRRLKRK
jgi:transcriptional regulator with XRE-family HTH domain